MLSVIEGDYYFLDRDEQQQILQLAHSIMEGELETNRLELLNDVMFARGVVLVERKPFKFALHNAVGQLKNLLLFIPVQKVIIAFNNRKHYQDSRSTREDRN